MADALALHGICKSFGGYRALDSVDFAVRSGEVHALLGENGAGKSTLMNVASGLYQPDAGTILMDGAPVVLSGARDAAARGIGMVHQHFKLVPAFSVLDNLRLFAPGRSTEKILRSATDAAGRMGFVIDPGALVRTLGVAEQQQLEILKVLIAGARVIILDEPTAVLSDAEAERLMVQIRGLAKDGAAVVLVTHKLGEALHHSDRITVLRGGRRITERRPAELDRASLTTMIVGAHVVETAAPARNPGAVRLRLIDVHLPGPAGRRGLAGLSLAVRAGEIYGVAGVAGNGQTELAAVLTALDRPQSGRIEIEGRGDVTADAPAHRRGSGMAVIPVDRYRHGLAGRLSVADNYALRGVLEGRFGGWLRLHRRRARAHAQAAMAAFDVQGVRTVGQRAALLSGGNAQKLVIAREFDRPPSIVVAHSPSRGLDVRAGAAVHDRLRAARDNGAAVVLISEDLDEILLLSDRVGVLAGGRLALEVDAPADRTRIGAAMVHHD